MKRIRLKGHLSRETQVNGTRQCVVPLNTFGKTFTELEMLFIKKIAESCLHMPDNYTRSVIDFVE